MFTDNIIPYAAFFGNLQFTLLGLAYAAHAASLKEDRHTLSGKRPFYKRIRW